MNRNHDKNSFDNPGGGADHIIRVPIGPTCVQRENRGPSVHPTSVHGLFHLIRLHNLPGCHQFVSDYVPVYTF
jgi:hypothetical protein